MLFDSQFAHGKTLGGGSERIVKMVSNKRAHLNSELIIQTV